VFVRLVWTTCLLIAVSLTYSAVLRFTDNSLTVGRLWLASEARLPLSTAASTR
jgi:hypothetical protein